MQDPRTYASQDTSEDCVHAARSHHDQAHAVFLAYGPFRAVAPGFGADLFAGVAAPRLTEKPDTGLLQDFHARLQRLIRHLGLVLLDLFLTEKLFGVRRLVARLDIEQNDLFVEFLGHVDCHPQRLRSVGRTIKGDEFILLHVHSSKPLRYGFEPCPIRRVSTISFR